MIETPALFPGMTAAQNLELQRIQRGIPDQSVIARSLQMAGLPDTGNKSVRNFSLVMRQRLGIAAALLNMPEFLILDEPTNHLDHKTKDILNKALLDFEGTLIVVSHDRDFM